MLVRDARSLSPKAQEALRERAVAMVASGVKKVEVARLLGVSRFALHGWVVRAAAGGSEALAARKRGPKEGKRSLLGWQVALIKGLVLGKHPDQLQLPGLLWTRDLVRVLIEQRCDVSISVETVGRYLKEWGLTVQKPARQAAEQNPEAVDAWMRVEYPALKARAREEGADIHFSDEVGVKSTHQTGTTWGEKGKTPVVRRSGKRYKINVIKSVAVSGQMRFMTYQGRFTASVFITFLDRLVRSVDRKIILVVDNHSAHRTKKVREWVAKHADQIELAFLPTYSPDLNPAELSNNDLKGNIGRSLHDNLNELIALVTRHLRRRQREPHIVASYVTTVYPI